jgi:methionyl-tRNA synthetase
MGSAYPTIAADVVARFQVNMRRRLTPAPCLRCPAHAHAPQQGCCSPAPLAVRPLARSRSRQRSLAHPGKPLAALAQRLAGRKVNFLTGTDEHGEKIALAAEKRGLSPQEHCDAIVGEYKSLWADLDISYDRFVRTTDSSHERIVQQVLDR